VASFPEQFLKVSPYKVIFPKFQKSNTYSKRFQSTEVTGEVTTQACEPRPLVLKDHHVEKSLLARRLRANEVLPIKAY
jgi:hypothetical protein